MAIFRQNLNSFVEQKEVITNVSSVKPKEGVFMDEVSDLLVICTVTSVFLIGVSTAIAGFDKTKYGDIKLFATDMVIDTEGIQMTSVIGTLDGRIFMCGDEDGNLYEFYYQGGDAWFGKRFHLINHSVSGAMNFLPLFSYAQSSGKTLRFCFRKTIVTSRKKELFLWLLIVLAPFFLL